MRGTQSLIVERFDRIRRDAPDRPLIHLPLSKATLTARDIWAGSVQQQAMLTSAGVGAQHLVMLATGNRPEVFSLWLACRTLGAAVLPVDSGTTIREMSGLAERFGATQAVLPATSNAGGLGAAHPFGAGLVRVECREIGPPPHLYAGAAVLKLTSGSTGLPKATFTTEPQLLADVEHITTAMDIRPTDCQMAAIPLSHAYGIGNLLLPLLVQGTAIVLRDTFVPQRFLADAAACRARIFPGVPFMFDHFRDHGSPAAWPRGLDRLISAGARLEPSTARAFHDTFGVKIHSFYGTSETGGIAFDDSTGCPEDSSVGRPMPGVSVTLRAEEGAPREGGRVHVAGPAVASGYAGDQPGPDGFTSGGFLTGDFGRFTDGGALVLTGRASSFINVAGRKVQPEEVEATLRTMPGIADVRVIAAADPARGQQIVACIVAGGEEPGVISIRQFCAARLAAYKIPRLIITLDRIPLTERGKTDRRRLQEIVDERLRGGSEASVL
jgi:acyl-CoA synthetase (AMP-forming)/AMP-acid ligase II